MSTKAINDYINNRYYRYLDYANYHATMNGIPDHAEDILNEVLLSVISKDENELIRLYEKKSNNGYRELDFFILRSIKTNAFSNNAPYRHKYLNKYENDENVHFSDLEILDEAYEEDDTHERFLNYINKVRKIYERLDLSKEEKHIFRSVILGGEYVARTTSNLSRAEKYKVSRAFYAAIKEILAREGVTKPKKKIILGERSTSLVNDYFRAKIYK